MSNVNDKHAALIVLMAKRTDYQPQHVLHLLLSVVTFGLWLPVWALVGISHRNERRKIDLEMVRIGSQGV